MADVTVTADNVARVTTPPATQSEIGYCGAVLTAGKVVYKDEADGGKFKLADANGTDALAAAYGIAMNGGAIGQPVLIATGGLIVPGFPVTVGMLYVLSATPGGIAPSADLASGWKPFILGIGITVTQMLMVMKNSGNPPIVVP